MNHFVTRVHKEPKEGQSIEGNGSTSGVGGARGHGGDDDGAAPATTTFRRGLRATTPAGEEDVDDPASISSIGMELLQPESEDIEEEVVHVEAAEGGDQPGPSDQAQAGGSKELKLILEGLERYFVFCKFVKTETKHDGRYSRQVHTGKAKCTNCGKVYSFTTQSRAHLKSHYDKMHKAQVPLLVAAIEGQSKRGRSRSGSLGSVDSSKDSDTNQPFKRRQLSLEESFHKKDVVSDEIFRKLYLSDEQEAELVEWLHNNPLFYNCKLKLYKDHQKKQQLMERKAKELNVKGQVITRSEVVTRILIMEVLELKTWYTSMRTRFAKLLDRTSGSGAAVELTERDSWILSAFSFMRPYIVRCPARTTMLHPAAEPVTVLLTQANEEDGLVFEEWMNHDPQPVEDRLPSPVWHSQQDSMAASPPKRARQGAAGTAGNGAMAADALLEEVQERAGSLSRVQEKLEKVLAAKSDFQEEVESFMHTLGRMALRLDMDSWMDVQQTLLADMSKACREAHRKRKQQTPTL